MTERIVLIGAGSAMFTRGLVADLIRTGSAADLVLDGHVQSLDSAAALADDLLNAQVAYLPWAQSKQTKAGSL